ncbi:hypothetical protein N7298_21945, partial [Aeromonas caviae]|uniref:hypothetical protein n=1 Tax=Aeromonas caviae TaxID=648 RepID=UPI00244D3AF4
MSSWPVPVIRYVVGPRAGTGTWCPGSPPSSALKVATAGRWVGYPVGPRPAPGSGALGRRRARG